jgi:putative acyl-CoA dehydrogenase
VERLVLALQGALLLKSSSAEVADAFCASRLDGDHGGAFGTLPSSVDAGRIARSVLPVGAA